MSRADRNTELRRKRIFFSDIPTNLDRNPVTGALATVTNEEAVKQAIRNLVLTGLRERPHEEDAGSKAGRLLFEPSDPVTLDQLALTIEQVIRNKEPRAQLVGVQVDQSRVDDESVDVTVVFGLVNSPAPVTLVVTLRRVR